MRYLIKTSLFAVLLTLSFQTVSAQPQEKMGPPDKQPAPSEAEAVQQVIDNMFDAMREGDGDKLMAQLVDGLALQRAGTNPEGKPQLGNTPMTAFREMLNNKPPDQYLDERIWDVDIKVDGRLASAWMKFAFYVNGEFSHCGVNSMSFFKGDEGWKVFFLSDTNQREGCDIPESVKSAGN